MAIVEEVRGQMRWYHDLNVRRFLEGMRTMMVLRRDMVLEDLAGL